jgi:hypothetical protein
MMVSLKKEHSKEKLLKKKTKEAAKYIENVL